MFTRSPGISAPPVTSARTGSDAIDVLVQHLTAQLEHAKEEMSPSHYHTLYEEVQLRLKAALRVRTFTDHRAHQWDSVETKPKASATHAKTSVYEGEAPPSQPAPAQPVSPAPRAPSPAALLRRVLSAPNLTPQRLRHDDENDSDNDGDVSSARQGVVAIAAPHTRLSTPTLPSVRSATTIRLVLDKATAQLDDGEGSVTSFLSPPSLSSPLDAHPRWTGTTHSPPSNSGDQGVAPRHLPHSASVVAFSSCSPRVGEGLDVRARSLRRSASLATVLSLTEDRLGEDAADASAATTTTTRGRRVVQYVRVSAAVAPAVTVRHRFLQWLKQRQRREHLTFTPSPVAPSLTASLPPRSERSRRQRCPLRIDATTIVPKPHGLAAKRAALDAEGWFCKGCLGTLEIHYGTARRGFVFPSLDDASFCFYTGAYYCARCLPPYRGGGLRWPWLDHAAAGAHISDTDTATKKMALPARIIQAWDFTLYPLNTRAYTLLNAVQDEPLFCLSALNARLYAIAPPILAAAHELRQQICAFRDVGAHCAAFRRSFYGERATSTRTAASHSSEESDDDDGDNSSGTNTCYIPCSRRYWIETHDWWSLADLIELHRCDGTPALAPATAASHARTRTTLTRSFRVASVSHSFSSIFNTTDITAQSEAEADVHVVLANTCRVWQALRGIRQDMARHVLACACCVRHSADVCRLCGPASPITSAASASAALRRELVGLRLQGLRRDGISRSPSTANLSTTDARARASMPASPASGQSSWGAPEDPALTFMRQVLVDAERAHTAHVSAKAAARTVVNTNMNNRTQHVFSRSSSVSFQDEHDDSPPSVSAVGSARTGSLSPNQSALRNGEHGVAREDQDESAPSPDLIASLPQLIRDHLVFSYDVVHVCHCRACGASYHRQCVAKALGKGDEDYTREADTRTSSSWCPLCQVQSAQTTETQLT